ncbi:MAG: asparaginase domain-containing protein [Methylococcales bacterium]|nr:asparaginase domain-containing protein [Methylococcales bacterium]
MKNILLVFTGGTIGSQTVNGTTDTSNTAGFRLLEMFAAQDAEAAATVKFKTVQPIQILSENLHPRHWSEIVAAIEAEDLTRFAGIIVTHGTDTLAFSAAALGLYFNPLRIPMLLVSSDMPLDNPDANGLPNFLCAVAFIRKVQLRGVFVAYRNRNRPMQVHLATRLASCLQLSSDFIGIQSVAFMQFADGEFEPQTVPVPAERPNVICKPVFSSRIMLIRPYPGLDYARFNLDGVDAILHDLYHSGTACTDTAGGERHSLPAFVRHCRQRALKVYLAPGMRSESVYASTAQLLSGGATMIWNMSLEAAYAKLALAYGNFEDAAAIDAFLEQDIAMEHL